jgi:osmoprotectant transport system permease protein
VLALAVSAVGFGLYPTLIALALYGLLPVFENTVAGLRDVPATVVDAAQGMGMSPRQRLWDVELPLALPLIIEGIKVATVINIGTATIGATVAAKCLGEVIMAGLLVDNMAYVLQGGLIVGLMAVLIYDGLGMLQRYVARRVGTEVD